jgi:hypothetical protein
MTTHTYDHGIIGKPHDSLMHCTCILGNVVSGPLVFVFISFLQCCIQYCILVSDMCLRSARLLAGGQCICIRYFQIMVSTYGLVIRTKDSWDIVVGTVPHYKLDSPGIKSQWGQDFPCLSRPAPRPTQPPVQSVLGSSQG